MSDERELDLGQAKIKVIGVGGAGGNMTNWLYMKGIQGAEIVACNTDQQHLDMVEADDKFLMGEDITQGLGAGGYPEKGAEAAQESINEIKQQVKDTDMVFVCAGMGGGTGTGAGTGRSRRLTPCLPRLELDWPPSTSFLQSA